MVRFKMFIRFKRNSLVLLPVIITSFYSNILSILLKIVSPRICWWKELQECEKLHFELRWTREDEKKPLMWTKQTCVPIGTIHIRRFHHDRYCAQATKTKANTIFFSHWKLPFAVFEHWKSILCLLYEREYIEVSVWCGFVLFAFASFHLILAFFIPFDKSHFAYMILHTYDSWHSFKCWFIQIFHMDVDRTIYREWERK